ncbi:hypothetical protein MNBD_DELTA03-1240 [hydrothermal vent metagenome]|uniref:SAP domain-containing protein n=1 Tax=hydrothermal vent metagenome TaxID=652676 RepID=A0A3B0VS72_9ZZZZ
MRIEEAVECMSKINLHRILDSYTKDTLKPDEETSRKRIISDRDILQDPENIAKRMQFAGVSFDTKALAFFLMETLLSADQYQSDEQTIIASVRDYEKRIIEEASSPEAFKYKDTAAVNTYKTVLEVALEDDVISDDEKRLLARLRTYVGLSLNDHHLIQASLNKFPKAGNDIHTEKEIKNGLVDLQRRGAVFHCNQCSGGPVYMIPEEIVPGVKLVVGIELTREAYGLLLDKLTVEALRQILDANRLPTSGKKDERIQRVRSADIQPSDALEVLSNDELYELCKKLPGVNVSGSKAAKTKNIIQHFDKLRVVVCDDTADSREKLYEYYVELATRDRENLLSNKVIKKDKDMDSAFEEATRYLFENKLGLSLEPMPGSEHADGTLRFPKSKELFMWDTKSKETIYDFPNEHFNQFRRYIHNSTERVNCFMVIAPEISDKAEENAYRLKTQSGTDTDLSLISADDLKWVAENWRSYATNGNFTLDVFNFTGILDRGSLKKRMKIFLK